MRDSGNREGQRAIRAASMSRVLVGSTVMLPTCKCAAPQMRSEHMESDKTMDFDIAEADTIKS